MKTILKKALALLLALLMTMSVVTVAAAEEAADPGFANQIGDYLEYYSSGNSGNYTNVSLKTIEDGKVTLSKTIEQTGKDAFDITLQITTQQNLKDEALDPNAAMCLVFDVSNSMLFCSECHAGSISGNVVTGKHKVDCKHYNAEDNSIKPNETRMTAAVEAAKELVDSFGANSGKGQRMMSVVFFWTDAQCVQTWVDASVEANRDALKAAIATATDKIGTNHDAALMMAKNLLDNEEVASIGNQYVVLMTDGEPTGYNKEESPSDEYITGYFNWNNRFNAAAEAEASADALKATGAEIYGIVYADDELKIHDNTNPISVVDWMKANVTTDAGHCIPASDSAALTFSFESIVTEIEERVDLWTVTDPMGDYINFGEVYGDHPAAFEDGILTWDLLNEAPSGYDAENGVYTYTMKYSITLDVAAEGFVFDTLYPANKATSLKYALVEDDEIIDGIQTDYFNIPTVFATENKDFTMTFEPGTASHICFLYVDKETGEVIYDSKIDFIDSDTSANIPVKEGYLSVVFIKQAQSGMIWTAEEVDEETLNEIIESVKENDKAYKGHNAVAYGEGAHDLVYKNGTKTVTYYFSATGVSFDDVEDIVGEDTIVTPETPETPVVPEIPDNITVEGLSVLDYKFNPVAVGADVDVNDEMLTDIGAGQMNANKFGAFEDAEDAANGVVKLTFDVVGKPVEIDPPIDVMIIADESGSMNMYGRADTVGQNISYMPCLNENHVYKVTGLQYNLNVKAGLPTDGFTVEDETYINPHVAGLECIVIKQWDDTAEGAEAVIEMVEAAGIVVPEGMTGQEVYTIMAKNWVPDRNHGYLDGDTYVEIPYVENNDILYEESTHFWPDDPEGYYSYWSPEFGNEYGCYDRMMLEKEAVMNLARKITNQNKNNRVAYVGFTRAAYPSLSSYGLGDSGFYSADDLDDLMPILSNTNGHDYTNYNHAIYMANKLISDRTDTTKPCYIVFISDGVPTTSGSYYQYSDRAYLESYGYNPEAELWSVLDKDAGDYPWYDEVYPVDTKTYPTSVYPNRYVAAAERLAKCFKDDNPDIPVYTVGFNANESACDLLKKIATSENHFFNCADNSDFEKSMSVLRAEMGVAYPSGVLTDVIGEDFDLIVDAEHPFTVADKAYETAAAADADEKIDIDFETETLSWTLDEVDEAGVRITFYVKLHDEKLVNDTAEDLLYQTNESAQLDYVDLSDETNETIELPTPYVAVPGTEPETPLTLIFEAGSASHICFLFVDENNNVIYDSKIDLEDNDTSVEIPVREGCVSVVFIKQAQSGLIWTSEEIIDNAVLRDIVDAIIENDPAYKGHSDGIAFGEGSHNLTYNVGNGKKAKAKTVTYIFE